jgi:hypothetical protein
MLWPHMTTVDAVGRRGVCGFPERFVRGEEQSARRDGDVITTRLDVGKTSPLR